jgi:hypothetical protein
MRNVICDMENLAFQVGARTPGKDEVGRGLPNRIKLFLSVFAGYFV